MFSDVVSPLPSQPDNTVQPNYQGDYDYGSALLNQHFTSWVDGRVTISGQAQQDAFSDHEGVATPPPITLKGNGRKVGGINTSRLRWQGATSINVDVYRDNSVIATTANDGGYDDSTGTTGQVSFTYEVCEAGAQTACSNQVVVHFGP